MALLRAEIGNVSAQLNASNTNASALAAEYYDTSLDADSEASDEEKLNTVLQMLVAHMRAESERHKARLARAATKGTAAQWE